MIAYKITQPSTQTAFITSDLLDVFSAIEKETDGTPVMIITKEMTVTEFENEAKMIAALQMTIKIPGTNESK